MRNELRPSHTPAGVSKPGATVRWTVASARGESPPTAGWPWDICAVRSAKGNTARKHRREKTACKGGFFDAEEGMRNELRPSHTPAGVSKPGAAVRWNYSFLISFSYVFSKPMSARACWAVRAKEALAPQLRLKSPSPPPKPTMAAYCRPSCSRKETVRAA